MRATALALLALPLVGCQAPDAALTLSTTGGHVVDTRSWAVGSRIGISASWDSLAFGQMGFRTESGQSLTREQGSWQDGLLGGPAMGAGYASRSGIVDRAEEFDVVVVDGVGREIGSAPLRSEEVSGMRLGVALDDCPEFADVVLPDGAAFVQDTEVMVYPAPLGPDGEHLLGGVDFRIETTGVTLPWGGGVDMDFGLPGADAITYPTAVAMSGAGEVAFDIAGERHAFAVRTVSPDEIVGLGIDAQAEKHGVDGESLLTVFGRTADGAPVFGLAAEWSTGGVATWTHATVGVETDACVGDLCVTWDGQLPE